MKSRELLTRILFEVRGLALNERPYAEIIDLVNLVLDVNEPKLLTDSKPAQYVDFDILAETFPGLIDGETAVNGGDLVEFLSAKLTARVPKYVEVDCDLCSSCRDHSGFTRNEDGETVSDCCGAPPVDVDGGYEGER